MFVFFGCKDILRRVLFLKINLCIGIWMYRAFCRILFYLYKKPTIYIYNICFFKNCMNITSIAMYINVQGVSKRALQIWKHIETYTEDILNVLNCQNVAKHTEFYLV